MGRPDLFAILLNNQAGVYFSGQTVDGQVLLTLTEEMKMRGLRLYFYGGASVYWKEEHTSGERKEIRHYRSAETYINKEIVLFGKATGASGDNPTLKAGEYTFPFSFQLPQNIPASYEGHIGEIRYSMNCNIDKPWAFDHSVRRPFTVISLVDLNTIPGATEMGQNQDSKTLCCCCCQSGPISCALHLDRSGYVPGEVIPIKGEILNQSSREMTKSFAKLAMVSHFYAGGKSKMTYNEVSKVERGPIEPGESDIWGGDGLLIPPVPPSILTGCRIINVQYLVELCVVPSGPSFDLVVTLPVIIGSIPLMATLQQYGITVSTNTPSYGPSALGTVAVNENEDGGDDEQGGISSQDAGASVNYTPMYAYYNWNTHGAAR